MNRKDFLKNLAMIPMAAFLGVETIPVADDKNAPVSLQTQSIFVPKPTPENLREAVQSLASRNARPFADKRFRGFITRSTRLKLYAGTADHVGYFTVLGTGVVFQIVPDEMMTHGALIFSKHSPFNVGGADGPLAEYTIDIKPRPADVEVSA